MRPKCTLAPPLAKFNVLLVRVLWHYPISCQIFLAPDILCLTSRIHWSELEAYIMLNVKLFSPNMPLWYMIHNNDPSLQGGGNPLDQNLGTFIYTQLQQPFLCYPRMIKGSPCWFPVPKTSLFWIPWFGTSIQHKDSRCKTLYSVLLKILITIIGHYSPTTMLIFFRHQMKPSWDILHRLDRVWDQQNLSRLTNHIFSWTNPNLHLYNQVHSQMNCTSPSITSVNCTWTTGWFPICYRIGNPYLNITYHWNYTAILVSPFE